jgi:hypothetical protein
MPFTGPAEPYEGILGLAYKKLASAGVTPLFESLVATGQVEDVFGLQLCDNWITPVEPSRTWTLDSRSRMALGRAAQIPTSATSAGGDGQIADGAYIGKMYYTPLVDTSYYSIHLRSIEVAGVSLNLPCSAYNSPGPSLVDSGTSVTWVPSKVHAQLVRVLGDRVVAAMEPASQHRLNDEPLFRKDFFAGKECVDANEVGGWVGGWVEGAWA